ncbi:MAG: type II/IV secretion system protein, partial [Verrucomicrobia bacterium]|nr:type II/IV secretion system protein [Verrucomicrobiota bacterium]NDD40837.1 type II/IV secretion system protein [Verrucomicrobiota bacterium]
MTIAEILMRKGLLSAEQLADAQGLMQAEGLRLDRAVVQKGWLTERQLLEVFSEQLHLPLVTLEDRAFDGELLRSLPARVVYRQRLVPVGRVDGILQVATSDPFDLYAFDDLRLLTGLNIQPVLATREEIEKVI